MQCRYPKVQQVIDEWPSRRPGRERRAPSPDKTSNNVQRQTSKEDIEDVDTHDDCNLMELIRRSRRSADPGTINDMLVQPGPALYHTITDLAGTL